MSLQFGTFDTLEDRRELIILFQRLGERAPDPSAYRAKWLECLIGRSATGFGECPVQVNPASCSPVGAYNLFVQIVGVLGIPIAEAAVQLQRDVRET